MAKCKNRQKRYICVGENFKDRYPIGYCGDVMTLMEWCCLLFRQDEEYIQRFFDGSYANDDVVDYIFKTAGKRLKSV